MQEEEAKSRRSKEEEEQRLEAERFQRKIEGVARRKHRGRNHGDIPESQNRMKLFYIVAGASVVLLIALLYMQFS